MTGERPPAGAGGGGGGGGGGFGGEPESTPPEFRSGFGAEGVKALQAFVAEGRHAPGLRQRRRSADSALRPAGPQHRLRASPRRRSGHPDRR